MPPCGRRCSPATAGSSAGSPGSPAPTPLSLPSVATGVKRVLDTAGAAVGAAGNGRRSGCWHTAGVTSAPRCPGHAQRLSRHAARPQRPQRDGGAAFHPPRQAESASGASFPPAAKSIKSAFHLCGSRPCSGLFYVAPVITPLDQQPGHVPQQFGKCISSINDNRLFKQQLKHSDCFLVCSH